MEENDKRVKSINWEEVKEKFESVPKFVIAGHELSFEIGDLDEHFIKKAKEELRETPEIVAQGIKELKELIAGEPDLHVPDDDVFCKTFLRPCKWYVQSAFSLMKRHFRFRLNYSRIFTDLIPSKNRDIILSGLVYPVPIRSTDGCRIVIVEGGRKWKPKEVSLDELFKILIFVLQAAMAESNTQVAGARTIIDMEGLSLSQVTYFTPNFAKMVVDFIQRCLPIRLKSIHVVNQPFIFNMVFALFKPFLNEKIRNRIHFHGTNRESLHAYIHKSALFTKYGGELEESEQSIGVPLWQILSAFEDLYELNLQYGYKLERNKK